MNIIQIQIFGKFGKNNFLKTIIICFCCCMEQNMWRYDAKKPVEILNKRIYSLDSFIWILQKVSTVALRKGHNERER